MDNDSNYIAGITGKKDNSTLIEHEPTVAVEVSVDDPNSKNKKKKVIKKFNFTPMTIKEAEHHAVFGLDLTDYHEEIEFEHEDKETEVMSRIMKKSQELYNKHTDAAVKKKGKATPQPGTRTTQEADAKEGNMEEVKPADMEAAEADEEYDEYDDLDRE